VRVTTLTNGFCFGARTAISDEDMAVGIESEEIAKGLDGDDGTEDEIPFRHRLPKKELQGIPGAAAQIGKKIPVIEKIPPQDLRDTEDEMSVGSLLEHMGTEPFPEFHHPLLMAGRSLRQGQAPLIYFSVGGEPAANRRLPDGGNLLGGPRGHKAAVAGQRH
jgi:hypothetical protein